MNTAIVAAGIKQDIGTRVVLWDELEGMNFYPRKKFNAHNMDLPALQARIQGAVVHHAAVWNAKQVFSGCIGRGLSVNFIIEDDVTESGCATIYQCLDIKDGGWSQTKWNDLGSGIEIALQPAYWQMPEAYSQVNQKNFHVTPHSQIEDTVHGAHFKCFGPTRAQHNALIALLNGYFKFFPNLPREFPKDKDGKFLKTILAKPLEYRGIVNHYNIDNQKIDCLGLDLKYVEDSLFYPN